MLSANNANKSVISHHYYCFFRVFCVITSRCPALHPAGRTLVHSKCSGHFSRRLLLLKFLAVSKGQVLQAGPKFTRVRFRIGCESKAQLKSNKARHNCAS